MGSADLDLDPGANPPPSGANPPLKLIMWIMWITNFLDRLGRFELVQGMHFWISFWYLPGEIKNLFSGWSIQIPKPEITPKPAKFEIFIASQAEFSVCGERNLFLQADYCKPLKNAYPTTGRLYRGARKIFRAGQIFWIKLDPVPGGILEFPTNFQHLRPVRGMIRKKYILII